MTSPSAVLRGLPWIREMDSPTKNFPIAWRPSVTMTRGRRTSRCRRSQISQAVISSGSGSRFSGGRCRTTLVMNTLRRSRPMPASSSSRNWPAAPTNGFPWTSSWYPGASPRKKIPDSPEPSPGTAWRALRWRGHAMHARISSATRPSSACCTRGGLWSRGRPDRSLSREVNDVRVGPPRHLLDLHDESGAREHREGLLSRRKEEALAAPAGPAEQRHRNDLLRVRHGVTRVGPALLRLDDERTALAERRGSVPEHALLICKGKQIEDVDDRDGVALGGRLRDDVADLEAKPLCVLDRDAADGDLLGIEVDPEDPAGVGGLAEQTGEKAVAAAQVDDEPLTRYEALDEGEIRQEGSAVHEEPVHDRRRAVAVDSAVQGRARARSRHQGTRQRRVSLPSAVRRSGSVSSRRSRSRSTSPSAAPSRSSTSPGCDPSSPIPPYVA